MENLIPDKNKLWSIFENIKGGAAQAAKQFELKTIDSDVLIIDGMNLFIRCYSIVPSMNDNGDLMGGLVGSLKSMAYAIRTIAPTRCIVVFDGVGGSTRRRKLYPEYKKNRKNRIRVNRMYTDISTPDMEERSMKEQLSKFVEYLEMLPVTIISVDNIEADDAIAYLTTDIFNKPDQSVTIMSADKDFLQLVNERVKVWSPTKKKMYGQSEVLSEYGINSKNFILYRILDGDVSDNIPGIKGAGLKTVIKAFPMLSDDVSHPLNIIKETSERSPKQLKINETILENWETVELNHKLMQLGNSDFTVSLKMGISDRVGMPVTKMKLLDITRQMTMDGIHSIITDYQVWLRQSFSKLDQFAK